MANYRIDSPKISKDYQRQQQTMRERQQQPNATLSGNYRVNDQGAPIPTTRIGPDIDEREDSTQDYFEKPHRAEPTIGTDSKVYQFDDYRSQEVAQKSSYDDILARQRGRSLGKYDQLAQQQYSTQASGKSMRQPLSANYRKDDRRSNNTWQQQLHQVVNPIRQSPSIQRLPLGRVKLFSVFAFIYMTMLICGWQLLPFNKVNQVVVSGNYFVTEEAIAESSRIRPIDTIDEVFKHRQGIEEVIVEENPIVDSILLSRNHWDHLLIQVNEHQIVAKMSVGNEWVPILTNGAPLDDAATLANLSPDALINLPTLVGFDQKSKMIELTTNLRQVDPAVLSEMDTIYYYNDSQKPNGIEVQMKDGNIVKAIISTFAQKVNYYPEILQQLDGLKGVVNFEVGAYFTPDVSNANTVNLNTN